MRKEFGIKEDTIVMGHIEVGKDDVRQRFGDSQPRASCGVDEGGLRGVTDGGGHAVPSVEVECDGTQIAQR